MDNALMCASHLRHEEHLTCVLHIRGWQPQHRSPMSLPCRFVLNDDTWNCHIVPKCADACERLKTLRVVNKLFRDMVDDSDCRPPNDANDENVCCGSTFRLYVNVLSSALLALTTQCISCRTGPGHSQRHIRSCTTLTITPTLRGETSPA